jgi:RNase_H superfamily
VLLFSSDQLVSRLVHPALFPANRHGGYPSVAAKNTYFLRSGNYCGATHASTESAGRTLKEINNPRLVLVHYGAYESRFLKLMRERWQAADEDGAFIERIVDGSTNLISSIYGKIYFPTYSNSLKDIARWLGFEWTWPHASGSGAILLRRCWELTRDHRLQRQLVAYNIEDCRAAELVTGAIKRIFSNSDDNNQTKLKAVNVCALEVGFQRTFGKFSGALPEFDKINAAAY